MPHQVPQPIFGINLGPIPIYPIMLFIAFIAGVIAFKKTFKKKFFSRCVNKRIKRSFFWSGIFGVLGSNVITWMVFEDVAKMPVFQRITQGGFSFYFGLLSFLLWATLFLRINKINLKFALNKIVSPILMVQFISRLGCSLAGCCFGLPIEFSGVTVHLPIRETEALFALVLLIALHNRAFGSRLKIYLFSYSVFRFITDFFRGDDRGNLLGIPFFSPTQIVAFFVIFISGAWLFARPFFKLIGKEQALDDFKKSIRDFFEKIRSNVFKKKTPYSPVPFNYVEPANQKHPIKIIIAVLLVITIIFLSVVYINPFNFDWFDEIKDSITYTFFKRNNVQDDVGALNGANLLRLYGETPISSDEEAMKFAKSYDQWKDFNFGKARTKRLSNGNNAYIFQQELNGKPIIGKTRVLVTDKDNKPLYIAGDEASLSVTKETSTSFLSATSTVKDAFGSNVTVIEKTDCWYDTGSGLIDAYHAVLSQDGKTAAAGAVLQKSDEKIICLTDPETKIPKNVSINNISKAGETVSTMLQNKDSASIKEASKTNISKTPDTEKASVSIEKAFCIIFNNLDMSAEQYQTIIDSTVEIAESISSISTNLLCEILSQEAQSALLNSGESDSAVQEVADVIAKAFNKCNLDAAEDECVSGITSSSHKTTYKHSINFASDVDAFSVKTPANHTTQVTLRTESPVQIEIYGADGRAIVAMFVEEEETVSLYPEDGTDFDFRISDCSGATLLGSAADYKLILESEEETVPEGIESTLSRISDAYDSSLAPVFLSMCLENGEPIPIEENLGLSLVAPLFDSIAQDCSGVGDRIDTSKTMIAGSLIKNGTALEVLYTLKGSEMELSYIDHIETEEFIALKAKILITLDGTEIYSGYTFMRLQDYDYDLSSLPEDQRETVELISTIFGGDYYITDMNQTYLYEMFGDTPDSISSTSDVESLYDLWYDATETIGVYPVPIKKIDTDKAISEGHSIEKIEAFERYTARYNIAQIKSVRQAVQTQYDVLKNIAENGADVKTVIDLCTNPLGFGLDKIFERFEAVNSVWKTYKLVTDTKGALIDELSGPFFESCGEIANEVSSVLDEFDQVIAEYEAQSQSLNK